MLSAFSTMAIGLTTQREGGTLKRLRGTPLPPWVFMAAQVVRAILLIACGAVPRPAVPGALTFRGPADTDALRELLRELVRGDVQRVAFVVPAGAAWALPAYELALLTARHLAGQSVRGAELTLLTPEEAPLAVFGAAASTAIGELLDATQL